MAQIKWRDLNRVRKSKWSKQCKHARHLKNKLNGLKQIKWQLNSKRKALLKIHKCKRNLTEESERSNVLQCTAKKPGSWNQKLTQNCIIWRSKVRKYIVTTAGSSNVMLEDGSSSRCTNDMPYERYGINWCL